MRATRRGALGLFGLAGLLPSQALAAANGKTTAVAGLSVVELKVEWLAAPEGIDTVRPRFSWILRAANRRDRAVRQTACCIVVGTDKRAVQRGEGDVWNSGKQPTSDLRLRPEVALQLRSQSRYWWSVMVWDGDDKPTAWSAPASFLTGVLTAEDWQARWIAAEPDRPPMVLPRAATQPTKPVEPTPLPVFRHDFPLSKPVESAVVSVCGLGHYELTVNGKAVTPGVLNPGWTNYRKTVFYNTFDITSLVKNGRNALAMMLGNGMYNVEPYVGRYTKFAGSFGQPKLILQLKIAHTDGSETVIVSDENWRQRPGPVVLSSAYQEDFDASKVPADWDVAAPADGEWQPALTVQGPGGKLKAQNIPPVVESKIFKPVSVTQPKPGVFVYDFGQNMSAWPKITVQGPTGTKIKLVQSELLATDGTADVRSSGGRSKLEHYFGYTLAGRGKERWHPRFAYWGFRYIQVEGAAPAAFAKPGEAVMHGMEAAWVHTDLKPVGQFHTSSTLFNRIHKLIANALWSNTVSVYTDCPHREKLGWLEQTYLNADTALCNADGITMYEKMIADICEAQTPDGMVPGIAPEYVSFLNNDGTNAIWRDSPEWGGAAALSPLATYEYYGDRRALEIGYGAMKRYADYLASRAKDGLIGFGMGDWDDVGPRPGPSQQTSLTLSSMTTYYRILAAIVRVAKLFGRSDDATQYAKAMEAAKQVFNAKVYNPATGGYDTNSQAANAMALVVGLVPEERHQKVLDNLIADIRAHGNHLTAGDVGFHYVVWALMQNSRDDVLYDMISRTDSPGYGYQLTQGATTLIESWTASRSASQNHYMFGHIETWFYRGLGGINLDMGAEGADRITIAPQFVAALAGVEVRYRSVVGEIVSLWRRKSGRVELYVTVPAGADAKIVLPAAGKVLESGVPLATADGVRASEIADGKTVVIVGSGDYRFSIPVH